MSLSLPVCYFRIEFDENIPNYEPSVQVNLKPALEIYNLVEKFLPLYKLERDRSRVECLCR